MDADSMVTGKLDRAQHQYLGAARGQLEHLLVGDGVELARVRDQAWVGGEDALDVGVDLASVGVERGGERDGGRVRAAPAERRHLVRGRDALEAGDEHDRALRERVVDPPRSDLEHLGARVVGIGDDSRLRAGERDRGVAEVVDRHRGERARDPLPDREQHVELARMRGRRDLVGEVDQVVGRPTHRGQNADDVVPRVARGHQPPRDRLQPLRPFDRRPAELLDEETHGETLPASRWWIGNARAGAADQPSRLGPRRGARAVESGGLENRWARKRPVGSNPTPAAPIHAEARMVPRDNNLVYSECHERRAYPLLSGRGGLAAGAHTPNSRSPIRLLGQDDRSERGPYRSHRRSPLFSTLMDGLQNDPMHPAFIPPRPPLWLSLAKGAIGVLILLGLLIYALVS